MRFGKELTMGFFLLVILGIPLLIFQTMMVRLEWGQFGPLDSYSEEEKACYMRFEASIQEDRKNGRIVNYCFPDDDL